MGNEEPQHGAQPGQKRKRKPKKNQKKFEELKHSGRTKRKRQMEQAFRDVTNTLHTEISEVKVELKFESGSVMTFKPRKADNTMPHDALQWERKEAEMKEVTQQFLMIKDKYRISDEAMHELHMVKHPVPSKNQIQDERQRLNTVIPIYPHGDVSTTNMVCWIKCPKLAGRFNKARQGVCF